MDYRFVLGVLRAAEVPQLHPCVARRAAKCLAQGDLFGPTVPFDFGVKVWLAHLETDDFLVAYRAKRVIIFFLFHLSQSPDAWNRMLSRFAGGSRLQFRGKTLRELVNYAWKDANPSIEGTSYGLRPSAAPHVIR